MSRGRFAEDLTGQRFGELVVINRAGSYISPKGNRDATWNCVCDCGQTVVVLGGNLRGGKTKSCGCGKNLGYRKYPHYRELYSIWNGIIRRCTLPTHYNYKNYGARGITVCDEWQDKFLNFYKWALDNGWRKGLSIDRINNDLGYSPANCRWATPKQQANNRRTNRYITLNGETHTVTEWSEKLGISRSVIYSRLLKHGWSEAEALLTPIKHYKKRTEKICNG